MGVDETKKRTQVLFVDDNRPFLQMVQLSMGELSEGRWQTHISSSASEALERLKAQSFDLAVLDFAMPGMDGIETLKALRALNPDLQVMLLTGQATIKAAVEATRLGAVDVLEKPTDVETLLEKIREARIRFVAAREKKSQEQVEDIVRKFGW